MSNLVADLNMVGLAWTVTSASRRDYNAEYFEGVVVGIDHFDLAEPETGEVTTVLTFRCRSPYKAAPTNLLLIDGADVKLPVGAQPPERNRIYRVCRNLVKAVAKPDPKKWWTSTEIDCVVDAYHLLMALEGR